MSEAENTEINLNILAENIGQLFDNTVNMADLYYNMFLNTIPMEMKLKAFNNDNELVEVNIPNRAADRTIALVGEVPPENVVEAPQGVLYIDDNLQTIYVKVEGSGKTGWETIGNATLKVRKYY